MMIIGSLYSVFVYFLFTINFKTDVTKGKTEKNYQVVLVSNSPRRKELLKV